MTHLFSNLRERMQKRAQYNQTVYELRSMPLDVALDLNIYREDAERIAYQAVYAK